MRKLQEIFREIMGNFLKKIAGHKTQNFEKFRKFFHKNAIKHYLWEAQHSKKILGSPQKTLLFK